jgi:hypothetical protein
MTNKIALVVGYKINLNVGSTAIAVIQLGGNEGVLI